MHHWKVCFVFNKVLYPFGNAVRIIVWIWVAAYNVFCEVTVNWTSDHQNVISSSSSPRGRLGQIWRNSSTRKKDDIKQHCTLLRCDSASHQCGFCLQVTTYLKQKFSWNKTSITRRLITWPVRCSWLHQRTSSWRSEPTRSPGWRKWRRVNHTTTTWTHYT